MADDQSQPPPDGVFPGPPAPQAPLQDQIILKPQAKPPWSPPAPSGTAAAKAGKPGPNDMKDGTREIIETVVFVVVLVLLLKTFLAEAFVIPTGSMADTLLGYHYSVPCEKCGYRFLVNASEEAEPQERQKKIITKGYCPNCRYFNTI